MQIGSMKRVQTICGEVRVAWHCLGHGPPLVLLHGGYGTWKHWIRNIEELSKEYWVLAPDMPGFGESDDPDDLHSLGSIARPILAGLDELIGSQEAYAVGAFSFGGSVAAAMVRSCASRMKALILVGSGGLRVRRPPPVQLLPWRHLSSEVERRAVHLHNLAVFMFSDPSRIDSTSVDIQASNTRMARVKSRPLSSLGLLHDVLGEYEGRLCGIWGEDDATARGYISDRCQLLRSFHPNTPFYTIPEAGHWVQYERHKEVNVLMLDFLRR
ncbi:alpha/beta fold hydrolase [Devosia naphthalenivorans]|uniref:alpha/beta fold hydrolase n=1 Tax=Devosia naphthalenivorans TaxID=2082392 RepID=UPI000D35BEA6|nr:alpha/beta fold hydrolase [Devosia naphthalenivorans]